ncbi:uncharacterized protein LOC110983634 isoform X1 [Acanthaster planci]|uniref:Uncharacterized protein LOC110983634 isoform X1 n=1 Tax=Acanthaster planci TaxID=133434 RepID=A0A8B7Z1T4_ACAPL|nr:uncharacterized protein LOC110983634 isoform X1 [Acanthaster planci]
MKTINLPRVVLIGLGGICLTTLQRCLQSTTETVGVRTGNHTEHLKMAQSESLWGLYIGDALSMPVHWYYDPYDIKRDYGDWLTGFVAPKTKHPSSILTISAVGGAGRSGNSKHSDPVIGSVILHDKLKYWQSNKRSIHYHQGMKAGDSTLNAVMAGVNALTLSTEYREHQSLDDGAYGSILAAYVKFMTTPGSHGDTYAESFHREFFKDWVTAGSPVTPEDVLAFAESRSKMLLTTRVDHNIDSIGALVIPVPVIWHCANFSTSDAVKHAVRLVSLTHCSSNLVPFVELFASTLHSVLNGASLREKAHQALESSLLGGSSTWKRVKNYSQRAARYAEGSEERLQVYQEAVSHFGLACYIKGALTSMFFLAYEFHDNFEGGVLTNTNCGGENCHRGAILGLLLGAEAGRIGKEIPQHLKLGIHSSQETIQDLLDAWN